MFLIDRDSSDSFNGLLTPPVANRSNLALTETTDAGLTLVVDHDKTQSPVSNGGGAEMRFELSCDLDDSEIVLEDESGLSLSFTEIGVLDAQGPRPRASAPATTSSRR
jgi:hypothetical protein